MALKFLNKKGWHTGSLRNIENVWKAEQKNEAEQKKLEELRKQIQEERDRSEFRLLQEQAGLVPKQERLEFLYDSGLAVGKGSSDGFKALETFPHNDNETAGSSSSKASVPGALFEEKPQSANDAWRKLHSDPLLMIRQREQEALARIKNNPIKMAMIRKSVEAKKHKDAAQDGDHKLMMEITMSDLSTESISSSKNQSNSEDANSEWEKGRRIKHRNTNVDNDDTLDERTRRPSRNFHRDFKNEKQLVRSLVKPHSEKRESQEQSERYHESSKHGRYLLEGQRERSVQERRESRDDSSSYHASNSNSSALANKHESQHKRHNTAPKLSEDKRAAMLREMQLDAQIHEEERWKRLKKAAEDDAREAHSAGMPVGRSFLDATHKSVYGTEKGGSSTIEESVRRRTHFLQDRSEADERNAFRSYMASKTVPLWLPSAQCSKHCTDVVPSVWFRGALHGFPNYAVAFIVIAKGELPKQHEVMQEFSQRGFNGFVHTEKLECKLVMRCKAWNWTCGAAVGPFFPSARPSSPLSIITDAPDTSGPELQELCRRRSLCHVGVRFPVLCVPALQR
ncbi:hypothetical protein Nepgr_012369 [Nepenthes gracilis]|uniref:CBF1-interacting co-repressor CIR N-terminal domain-containing protein n=1 Tax=Nepenthes gracilis TaxID=150966 RepID=A0AAD3XN10_NEPGR|nr:hypothetical protein Nepgr_012369 [Nepenthes gracilis]